MAETGGWLTSHMIEKLSIVVSVLEERFGVNECGRGRWTF